MYFTVYKGRYVSCQQRHRNEKRIRSIKLTYTWYITVFFVEKNFVFLVSINSTAELHSFMNNVFRKRT